MGAGSKQTEHLPLQASLAKAHQGALLAVEGETATQVKPLANPIAIEQPQSDAFTTGAPHLHGHRLPQPFAITQAPMIGVEVKRPDPGGGIFTLLRQLQ